MNAKAAFVRAADAYEAARSVPVHPASWEAEALASLRADDLRAAAGAAHKIAQSLRDQYASRSARQTPEKVFDALSALETAGAAYANHVVASGGESEGVR